MNGNPLQHAMLDHSEAASHSALAAFQEYLLRDLQNETAERVFLDYPTLERIVTEAVEQMHGRVCDACENVRRAWCAPNN